MKGLVVRTTPGICNKRLFKGKYVDQIHVLKESFAIGRVGNARCYNSRNFIVNGLNNAKPNRYEPSFRGPTPAEAILTPVSDPTPTAQKVRTKWLFVSPKYHLYNLWLGPSKMIEAEHGFTLRPKIEFSAHLSLLLTQPKSNSGITSNFNMFGFLLKLL